MTRYVKRFFVFDMHDKRAIMYFNSATATDKPSDVIPLGSLIAVRKEKNEDGHRNNRLSSVERDSGAMNLGSKNLQLSPSEKPNGAWTHVLEIQTNKRCYRLFSDRYDIKEQWFFALNQIVLHRDYLD